MDSMDKREIVKCFEHVLNLTIKQKRAEASDAADDLSICLLRKEPEEIQAAYKILKKKVKELLHLAALRDRVSDCPAEKGRVIAWLLEAYLKNHTGEVNLDDSQ